MVMPPLLNVPVGATIPSRFFVWTQDWTPRGERWHVNSTPRRTDIARSALIWDCIRSGRDCWQWDSDVISALPYSELLRIIQEDLRAGYDIVIAPTAGMNGKVLLVEKDKIVRDGPFEVYGPMCGMWYATVEALKKLKPIGQSEGIMGESHPMFCTYSIIDRKAYSEDADLAYRAREVGLKLCADGRLQVRHMAKMDAVVV